MDATRVIRKPILTEKSLLEAASGVYTFEVDLHANKPEIAKAVKELFKVDVKDVKTRIQKNRKKRVMGKRTQTTLPSVKKATIKVGKEQKIDLFEVKQ